MKKKTQEKKKPQRKKEKKNVRHVSVPNWLFIYGLCNWRCVFVVFFQMAQNRSKNIAHSCTSSHGATASNRNENISFSLNHPLVTFFKWWCY